MARRPTPLEVLESWDLRKTPDAVIEAERRDARLRAEGWSVEAIKHRANEAHPLSGAVEAYHGTSLMPQPIEYAFDVSAVKKRPMKTSIRFPWWRNGVG